MVKKPDIHRLIELQRMMLKFREIKRIIDLPGDGQRENDAEHSYTLAMTAWFLAPTFPHLDRDRLIRICLAHDLVEIHAGDTFAYGDASSKESKNEREKAATDKLAKEWPDFPELTDAIHDYKERKTEEAKFVYALDKIMPALIMYIGDGYGWHKHNITIDDFRAEKEKKVAVSPEIVPYYQELYELIKSNPHLMPSPSQQR